MVYHHCYHYVQHTYSLNYVALEIFSSCPFLPHVILRTTKIIACVHTLYSTYVASRLITFVKELLTRYCQSLSDKLTIFCLDIVILDRNVQ